MQAVQTGARESGPDTRAGALGRPPGALQGEFKVSWGLATPGPFPFIGQDSGRVLTRTLGEMEIRGHPH
jgi:hypothetical protein